MRLKAGRVTCYENWHERCGHKTKPASNSLNDRYRPTPVIRFAPKQTLRDRPTIGVGRTEDIVPHLLGTSPPDYCVGSPKYRATASV